MARRGWIASGRVAGAGWTSVSARSSGDPIPYSPGRAVTRRAAGRGRDAGGALPVQHPRDDSNENQLPRRPGLGRREGRRRGGRIRVPLRPAAPSPLDRRRDYELLISGYSSSGCRTTRSSRTSRWRSRRSATWSTFVGRIPRRAAIRHEPRIIADRDIVSSGVSPWRAAATGKGHQARTSTRPARDRLEAAGLIEAEKRKSTSGRGYAAVRLAHGQGLGLAGGPPR